VGGVVGELPLTSNRDETRRDEAIEVVIQRRPGDVEALLQICGRDPFRTGLNNGPEEGETGNMPECSELLGVTLDLCHVYVSSVVAMFRQAASRAIGVGPMQLRRPAWPICTAWRSRGAAPTPAHLPKRTARAVCPQSV
jgi:hypothetical protein